MLIFEDFDVFFTGYLMVIIRYVLFQVGALLIYCDVIYFRIVVQVVSFKINLSFCFVEVCQFVFVNVVMFQIILILRFCYLFVLLNIVLIKVIEFFKFCSTLVELDVNVYVWNGYLIVCFVFQSYEVFYSGLDKDELVEGVWGLNFCFLLVSFLLLVYLAVFQQSCQLW